MNQLPINEAFLQQIELLQLLIKDNIAGLFGGNHKSKTFGSSCEFADYRDYIPGDDLKKVDWNAYERRLHTRIYLDASRSMGYGNGKKDVQAIRLAAALAYLSVCDMDKVSIYVVRNHEAEEIISGMQGKDAYLQNIVKLNEIAFEGDSFFSDAILPTRVGYGDGISILISDFLTDNDYSDAINYLAEKRRDIFCIQVLSREELKPKLRGKVHLFDSENSSLFYRKNVNKDIINAYKQAVEYATGRVRELCLSRGAEYMLVSADEDLGDLLFDKFVGTGVLK